MWHRPLSTAVKTARELLVEAKVKNVSKGEEEDSFLKFFVLVKIWHRNSGVL